MTALPCLAAPPGTPRMAPESCQEDEAAEKKAPLSQVDQELVSAHLEPPVGAPQEPGGPTWAQDATPSSTRVVFSVHLQ